MGRDAIADVFYITAQVERVILLRAFVKKTQKTQKREIELAIQRMRSLQL
jgi:phage-related protein